MKIPEHSKITETILLQTHNIVIVAIMVLVQIPANVPSPRLCVITKSAPNDEYGFNLHAERARGQFVGAVDEGSIAQRAGLRSGDRIFAVNGESISQLAHKEVVHRIKMNPTRCELLVIDEAGARWYAEHSIPISPLLPNIIRTCSPRDYDDLGENEENIRNLGYYPGSGLEQEQKVKLNQSEQPSFMVAKSAYPLITAQYTPQPRLCRLVKSNPTNEFGFNLHAEHGKGHFIGAVDGNGIAHAAGLETGQRIVGVNGRLIFPNTPHHEVVAFIKQNPLNTELLVASEAVDRWYADNGVPYSYERAIVYSPHMTAMTTISCQNGGSATSPLDDGVRQHFYNSSGAVNYINSATSTSPSRGDQRMNGSAAFIANRRSAETMSNGYDSDRKGRTCSTPMQHETLSYNSANASLRDDLTTRLSLQTNALANGRTAAVAARPDNTFSGCPRRDKNQDIFKMSAREALLAVRIRAGVKKTNDPRLNPTLSLEDKHRLIANL